MEKDKVKEVFEIESQEAKEVKIETKKAFFASFDKLTILICFAIFIANLIIALCLGKLHI